MENDDDEIAERTERVVSVPLGLGRDYDIFIGPGLTYRTAELLPFSVEGSAAFIITDENAAPYAATVMQALEQANAAVVYTLTLPQGEETKSFGQLEKIISWLLGHRVRRSCPLIAVGGGVVGDIAGFAAAVTLRGLPFVQVPTTLLAQVDSAVGGKTGINMPQGKNLVGAFYQPAAVIADTDSLGSLPPRQIRAGYAEILKYALIGDPGLFVWLERRGHTILGQEPRALARAIAASCAAKAEIVGADEYEREGPGARRSLLNLGHTFGHALEAAAGYDGRLIHGEAVAIGTAIALDVSARMNLLSSSDADRVLAHMADLGLPVQASDIPGLTISPHALFDLMQADKKAGATGGLRFILLEGIGQAFIADRVPQDVVLSALAQSLGQTR